MNTTATNEKKPYVAPELTTVSFKTERGYTASTNFLTLGLFTGSSQDQDGMQDYEVQENQSWI